MAYIARNCPFAEEKHEKIAQPPSFPRPIVSPKAFPTMHSVAVFLASFPFLVAAWSTFDRRSTDGVNYTSVFAPGLSSGASIYFPRQADYNTSTVQRATIWDAPTFAVTIKPANDEDVQYIVGG